MPMRLVVLVSGSGTLLQSLLDSCASGELDADVVAVGADRSDAFGLLRAERAGVATFVHPLAGDRAAWDAELAELVSGHEPDLVVSAGFMKLVGPVFLTRFGGRTINTHPALLPSFPGMHAVRDALAHQVLVTGATLFLIDEGVDTGRILAQEPVRVLPEDTVESLHERIKIVERRLLIDTINELSRGNR